MSQLDMMEIIKRIFPICRSITGNGVRETLSILKEYCPEMRVYEIPSGTKVFDWTIPREWNIEDAYIENENGERIVDFKDSNLHVIGYAAPIDQWMSLEEMKQIVYTLPSQPEVIPYVTSYYQERSGFCMAHTELEKLKEGNYHVVIRSSFNEKGSLTYGEIIFPGMEEPEKEIFITSYICHPSMANNECSGPAVVIALAEFLRNMKNRRYTYRLVLAPETIGAITYLANNLQELKERVIAGFNLTCVGDNRTYSIVHSRYGNTLADRVLINVLKSETDSFKEYSYLERGSDERQYCAPGVDLPLCTFCRSKFYDYPEYHTSADNLDIISEEGLQGALHVISSCINILEENHKYQTTCLCEPQLGKRGLYPEISKKGIYDEVRKLQDFILYADGTNDLLEISEIIDYPAVCLLDMLPKLLDNKLFRIVD